MSVCLLAGLAMLVIEVRGLLFLRAKNMPNQRRVWADVHAC